MAEVGEVEIVFTGLCSFLNLRNTNGTMPNPSVILPRTTGNDVPHMPFIAFDTREVKVKIETEGSPSFGPVRFANDFSFRALDGHELIIKEDMPGWPNVLASYDLIAKKDLYWPEVRNKWNSDLVPVGNDVQTTPPGVAALVYFGGGTISAERMTDFPWEFRDDHGVPTVRDYYAQELVYRIYPYQPRGETIDGIPASDRLTITLRSLGVPVQGEPVQEATYTFTSIREGVRKIKLWIGNNDEPDIHRALLRLSSRPRRAVHFAYLNRIAPKVEGIDGPIPTPLVPGGTFPREDNVQGGGSDTGYCGPHNASA